MNIDFHAVVNSYTRRKRKKKKKNYIKPNNYSWAQNMFNQTNDSSTYQAPHDNEHDIIDLTDDKAPNLHMSSSTATSKEPKTRTIITLTTNMENQNDKPQQETDFNTNRNPQSVQNAGNETKNVILSKKKRKNMLRIQKYMEMKLQKFEMKKRMRVINTRKQGGEKPGSLGVNDSDGNKAEASSEEKPRDVLEDLPPEVKAVIEQKLKDLPTNKKPIIMPPIVEEPIDDQIKNEIDMLNRSESSAKPIEVRVVTENRFQSSTNVDKKAAKRGKNKEANTGAINTTGAQTQFQQSGQIKEPNLETTAFTPHSYQLPAYSYPKGIPKSFLIASAQENETQLQTNILQQQSNSNLPSWMIPSQNPYSEQPISFSNPHVANTPTLDQTPSTYYDSAQGYQPIYVQTDNPGETCQAYSPSDVYAEMTRVANDIQDPHEGSESPDFCQSRQKRLSAFQRLGPLTQPKKPKLTINLMVNKEHSVREVVDETENAIQNEVHYPVHLKPSILSSTDTMVTKYLPIWPWKKNVSTRKTVSSRYSKSVMILEQEQMEEYYDKDGLYIQVTVKGYPPSWKKENVLDAVLNSVMGKSFIPCFIEFDHKECKFLVIRSRSALLAIHKYGFQIMKDDVQLNIAISVTDLSMKHLDFMPRLVLRQRLALGYDGERKLKLNEFTLQPDVSHFIYFPLNRTINQTDLIRIQSVVAWNYLTDLDLSYNRITSIEGFDFLATTPRLKHLDLSNNYIENVTALLCCRNLPLHSLKLEGNPLCHDYIDSERYVEVIKMIFPTLKEIDDVTIQLKGDMPKSKRNYCPEIAKGIVDKFLDVYFPLLDLPPEERLQIHRLYDENAIMTITCKKKLRYGPLYRYFRNLFLRSRVMEDNEMDSVNGAASIAKHVCRWPALVHDPYTFTVDVLYHEEYSTVLRVGGILKVTAESLAEDEHLLAFNKTIVLHSTDGIEYKIMNELVHWDIPVPEYANCAFQINMVKSRNCTLKLESAPDEDLKRNLVNIFMKLTEMDKKPSERCLEIKDWNLQLALQHFIALLKLDNLQSLYLQE